MTEPSLTDEQKTLLGHEALKAFFDSFGENDVYKRLFLEELFRGIFSGEYDLSLLGESGQTGRSGGNGVPGQEHRP